MQYHLDILFQVVVIVGSGVTVDVGSEVGLGVISIIVFDISEIADLLFIIILDSHIHNTH